MDDLSQPKQPRADRITPNPAAPSNAGSSAATSSKVPTAKVARRGFLTAVLAGVGYWSCRTEHEAPARGFVIESDSAIRAADVKPHFTSRMIEHSSPLSFVHCASITQSKSGDSICTWYGGSREGARDVKVWLSTLPSNSEKSKQWSEPRAVMDYVRAGEDTHQFVRKVGNAVTFFDPQDRLWMIYVSIAMGGWATSSLNATYSDDRGQTWSTSQRLWLSPLMNISQLVRCPPIFMNSGEIGLPIYNECAGIYPEMLWLQSDEARLSYQKSRICGGREWLQPSVVPTGDRTAFCYLRCLNDSRRVGLATTEDAGLSWTSPTTIDLPNPNSAVCAIRLNNSAVLMALNHSTDSRDSISLVYSSDGINDWKLVATLDHQPGEKFSYPSMIRGRDGMIHLVYSWQMKKIRHVSLNEAWIASQLNKPADSVAFQAAESKVTS